MRKGSLQTQTSEPVIVVDDSGLEECEEQTSNHSTPGSNSEDDSPTMNPYLLSPWRDTRETRKHSLPTPQCSGITASQVRRLSERGEGTGPGPRQTEFLATLSTAPAPVPGGRRHSVVTISKLPSSLFGRNRRESVAAFPSSAYPSRILPSRRESITGPPSTEPRGSVHNLQLDIMDDIVQARKVRMKLWNTSNERVCEVQPLDEAGGVQRYKNSSGRRYSDFVGTTLAPIPSSSKRRASELPPPATACASTTASKKPSTGIVCSNTDLISILSSLTSSAMEINQCEEPAERLNEKTGAADQKRRQLKTSRSNSFDISILYTTDDKIQIQDSNDSAPAPSNWFVKRHQPMSSKTENANAPAVSRITFAKETSKETKKRNGKTNKVLWDERSGSIVDAAVLGNAIEVFLRRTSPDTNENTSAAAAAAAATSSKGAIPKTALNNKSPGKPKSSWFSGKGDEATETCDSSLCSTLKDLFVK